MGLFTAQRGDLLACTTATVSKVINDAANDLGLVVRDRLPEALQGVFPADRFIMPAADIVAALAEKTQRLIGSSERVDQRRVQALAEEAPALSEFLLRGFEMAACAASKKHKQLHTYAPDEIIEIVTRGTVGLEPFSDGLTVQTVSLRNAPDDLKDNAKAVLPGDVPDAVIATLSVDGNVIGHGVIPEKQGRIEHWPLMAPSANCGALDADGKPLVGSGFRIMSPAVDASLPSVACFSDDYRADGRDPTKLARLVAQEVAAARANKFGEPGPYLHLATLLENPRTPTSSVAPVLSVFMAWRKAHPFRTEKEGHETWRRGVIGVLKRVAIPSETRKALEQIDLGAMLPTLSPAHIIEVMARGTRDNVPLTESIYRSFEKDGAPDLWKGAKPLDVQSVRHWRISIKNCDVGYLLAPGGSAIDTVDLAKCAAIDWRGEPLVAPGFVAAAASVDSSPAPAASASTPTPRGVLKSRRHKNE